MSAGAVFVELGVRDCRGRVKIIDRATHQIRGVLVKGAIRYRGGGIVVVDCTATDIPVIQREGAVGDCGSGTINPHAATKTIVPILDGEPIDRGIGIDLKRHEAIISIHSRDMIDPVPLFAQGLCAGESTIKAHRAVQEDGIARDVCPRRDPDLLTVIGYAHGFPDGRECQTPAFPIVEV